MFVMLLKHNGRDSVRSLAPGRGSGHHIRQNDVSQNDEEQEGLIHGARHKLTPGLNLFFVFIILPHIILSLF